MKNIIKKYEKEISQSYDSVEKLNKFLKNLEQIINEAYRVYVPNLGGYIFRNYLENWFAIYIDPEIHYPEEFFSELRFSYPLASENLGQKLENIVSICAILLKIISDPELYNSDYWNGKGHMIRLQWWKYTLSKYDYNLDLENWLLSESEQKLLLKEIDIELLSNLVFAIKNARNFDEKEELMFVFSKKMLMFLSWPTFTEKLVGKNKPYSKEFIDKLKEECGGYFRHSPKKWTRSKLSKEYLDLSEEQKNEKIEATIPLYLGILAFLSKNDCRYEIDKKFN